jgi:serine/threonine protein kinase
MLPSLLLAKAATSAALRTATRFRKGRGPGYHAPTSSPSRWEPLHSEPTPSRHQYFSDACIIGKGSFGVVYRAKLFDGSVVAVKRLQEKPGRHLIEERSWLTEVEALGKVRHRNLVPLLGVCTEGGERLLVFDFFPGGNLRARLHESPRVLSWADRARVARGVCRGLTYLHNDIR